MQATPRPANGRLENLFMTTVAEKTKVLGVASLLRGEESAAAEAVCSFLQHEKIVQLLRDLLKHYNFSSICEASLGSGDMLLAAFDMNTGRVPV